MFAKMQNPASHLVRHSHQLLQIFIVQPIKQGHRGEKGQEALLLLLLGALGQILKRVPVDAPDFALDLGWRGQGSSNLVRSGI